MSDTDMDTEVFGPGTEVELAHESAPAPILGELPTVPADRELTAMYQLANVFAASDLVPKDLRHKPNNCLLVMMTARELGLSFTVAFRECHVIEGKVTTSPKLRKAIVQARGIGKVWAAPDNDAHGATWYAVRADNPDVVASSTFTWADAQRVTGKGQLVGPKCTPDRHDTSRDKCGCKDNWRNYPQRQLSWRALGYLMDDVFSEVATGLYDPDELGAVTDEAGRPVIDVDEVQVPEGMASPRGQRRRGAPAGPGPADPEQLAELRDRIKALPEDAVMALRDRWTQPRSAEAGGGPMLPTTDEGQPATGLLNARSIKAASALVASFEREVANGKYSQTAADPSPGEGSAGAASEAEDEPKATQRQQARLHALLKEKRNVTGDDRHQTLTELVGRTITSAADLTDAEARTVIDTLDWEPAWGDGGT